MHARSNGRVGTRARRASQQKPSPRAPRCVCLALLNNPSCVWSLYSPSSFDASVFCIGCWCRDSQARPLLIDDTCPACPRLESMCSDVVITRFWRAACFKVAICSCLVLFACVCCFGRPSVELVGNSVPV